MLKNDKNVVIRIDNETLDNLIIYSNYINKSLSTTCRLILSSYVNSITYSNKVGKNNEN